MTPKIRPHHIHEDVVFTEYRVHIRQYAVIRDARNHVLLLKHGESGHRRAEWTLPGGKLLSTEPHLRGISRECWEELGFSPELAPGVLPNAVGGELWLFYRAHIRMIPTVRLSREHVAYAWKNVEELDALEFRNRSIPDAIHKLINLDQ